MSRRTAYIRVAIQPIESFGNTLGFFDRLTRRRAGVGREMRAELLEVEVWFLNHGFLDKNWRDLFKITD
jgi:hypothetical protein